MVPQLQERIHMAVCLIRLQELEDARISVRESLSLLISTLPQIKRIKRLVFAIC